MDRQSLTATERAPALLFQALCWSLAIGAGVAFFAWLAPSLAAAAVVAWYVLESVSMVALLFGPRRREALRAWVLPRAAGTALGIGLAYLWLVPWDQVAAMGYLILSLLEALYRLLLRRRNPAILDRRWQSAKPTPRPSQGAVQGVCTVLCVLLFSVTLLGHEARQVALDARFYVSLARSSELYEEGLRLAGQAMLDLLPRQDPNVRRGIAGANEQDLYVAAQQLLPQPWTLAVVEQTLEATLSWLASHDDRRVPPVTLPIGGLQRHLKDALSMLIDRRAAALPLCSPDAPNAATCRPPDVSVAAYVATYKPSALAAIDDAWAMIPTELDLATGVTLAPRAFRAPLALASEMRARVGDLNRGLGWLRASCLLSVALLALLGSETTHIALRWLGGTTFAAGIGAWLLGLVASLFWARPLAGWLTPRALPDLPESLAELPFQALNAFFRVLYTHTWPWALLTCGLGLGIALLGIATPVAFRRPVTTRHRARILALALAFGLLVWPRYQILGQQLYTQAALAHRRGQVVEAMALYRQVDRFYALVADDFVRRARRGLRECQRYQQAEVLYTLGDAAAAAMAYEALIATDPALALRDVARQRLLESSYGWASDLEQAGEYERALDRYRFILGEYRDRPAQQAIADLHLARGQVLQDQGDYRGAIATYGRIAYDVYDPRLWALADDRAVDAYCAWSASLQALGRDARAAEVCAELSNQLSAGSGSFCPACEP